MKLTIDRYLVEKAIDSACKMCEANRTMFRPDEYCRECNVYKLAVEMRKEKGEAQG